MKNSNISILAERIIKGIKYNAKKIPDFDSGLVRLIFVPRHEFVFDFWGIAVHESDISFIDTIGRLNSTIRIKGKQNLEYIPKTSIYQKVYHVLYTDNYSLDKAPDPVLYFDVIVLVSGSNTANNSACADSAGVIIMEWCNTITQPDCLGHLEKYLSVEAE